MPQIELDNRFGDYIAKELISENSSTRSWRAEQISVGRAVLIEELKANAPQKREEFLADVRAKAAVDHPLVGSIYEASSENGICFFAHELLPGQSLKEMAAIGKKMRAVRFVHLLHRIAEANLYHEAHGNATSPLSAESIVIDDLSVVRIKNLAVSGERIPDHSIRDVMKIGADLKDLVDVDHQGATRCLTLLAWMRGEQVKAPISWESVRSFCEQIELQLTEPATNSGPQTAVVRPEKKSGFVIIVAVLLVGVLIGVFFLTKKKRPPTIPPKEQVWITLTAGTHTTPEGQQVDIKKFEMSAHEVTIGEYEDFVETLYHLSSDGSDKTFDHPEQPADKIGHLPDDWQNLLAAAKKGDIWNGKQVTLNTPVVGVDWWDAYAFSKRNKSFLPTQEQWHYALMAGTSDPSKILVSDLVPTTDEKNPDKTKNGLLAMAGSVAEWTAEPRPSPDNPLGAPKWIIIGGSYLKPSKGASTREWLDNRSARRPDLGFRVCRSPE